MAIKFKIAYVVTIDNEQIGYVKNEKEFKSIIENQILEIAGN